MNRMVYQTDFYAVEETKNKDIIVHDMMPESSAVIALHEGCILLVCQHRPAVGESTWELPGGTIEPGEDRMISVQRELEEEAGIRCGEIIYIGSAYPAASLANRQVHFYFTNDVLKVTELKLDEEEDIAPRWVPLREIYCGIRDGEVSDGMLGHGLMLCILRNLLKID